MTGEGPFGAVAGKGAGYYTGIICFEGLVIDIELCGHSGPEVVEDDIGLLHQLVKHFSPLLAFQIDAHAFFVAVHG